MNKIAIILPCFNEEERLDFKFFEDSSSNNNYHFYFVNDGSTDGTLHLLKEFRKNNEDRIFIHDLDKNYGKSEAVRQGVLYANLKNQYEVIGFMDADLSTPLSEVNWLLSHLNGHIYYVFGSRFRRIGSQILRKRYRHYTGRVFATIASIMLGLPVYDTQCGAKFFTKNVILPIFKDPFQSNWTFDIEIFYRLRNKYGCERFLKIAYEVPLNKWKDINGSKLKLKHVLLIPFELIKLHRFYRV
jgi:glycosyltransferase involved in cell wall biosynthesis